MMKHIPISRDRQRGVGLVAALFLVVVFGALGAFIVTIGATQQAAPVLAIQGARAYHAARSGIDWGIYQAIPGASCAALTTFPISGPGLNGFTVAVQCNSTPHVEGGTAFQVFTITSTATFGAFSGSDFYSRTIEATVTDAP